MWLCAGKVIDSSSGRCLADGENLETFRFYDLTADTEFECAAGTIQGEGWVGPGSEGETTHIEFLSASTNCKPSSKALNLSEMEVTNVCEKLEAINTIRLPYLSLLLLKQGESYNEVTAKSGANPGLEVTCKTALGNVTDKCEKPVGVGTLLEIDNLEGNATEAPLVDVLYPFAPVEGNTATRDVLHGWGRSRRVRRRKLTRRVIGQWRVVEPRSRRTVAVDIGAGLPLV